MSKPLFQLSKLLRIQSLSSNLVCKSIPSIRNNFVEASDMGKAKKRRDKNCKESVQGSSSSSSSSQSSSSRKNRSKPYDKRKDDESKDRSSMIEFLKKNETRFQQDIQALTPRKTRKDKEIKKDKSNNVITFRPKLVVDHRHKSLSSSATTTSPSSSGSRCHSDNKYKFRHWRQFTSSSKSDDFNFTVLSYNILADNLMKHHSYLYQDCDQEQLGWETRWEKIKIEVRDLDWPDVICLQEVQFHRPDHCHQHILPFFNDNGYTTVLKRKTGNKDDGCLTAFRKDKFQLEESVPVDYRVERVSVLNRDNVGLVLKLFPVSSTGQHQSVIIANTHLLYNPKRADVRLCQMSMLLAEIDRLQDQSSTSPVIVTGDFNSEPGSHVVKLLCSGEAVYSGEILGVGANRPAPHKLLPDSLGLTDSCQWTVTLEQRGHDHSALSGSGSFWHRLGLRSVHPETSDAVTTFQRHWIMVDYMMFTPKTLKLIMRLELPHTQTMENTVGRIPSTLCPSDHLPLVAKFRLKKSGK